MRVMSAPPPFLLLLANKYISSLRAPPGTNDVPTQLAIQSIKPRRLLSFFCFTPGFRDQNLGVFAAAVLHVKGYTQQREKRNEQKAGKKREQRGIRGNASPVPGAHVTPCIVRVCSRI